MTASVHSLDCSFSCDEGRALLAIIDLLNLGEPLPPTTVTFISE